MTLDRDLCHGCINCVKRCPTEAIRCGRKAKILSDRCIDCGNVSVSARTMQNRFSILFSDGPIRIYGGPAGAQPVWPVQ
ncbi:MAG: 4Fe-4S binding protein [[Clostridium] leptum]